MEKKKFRIGNLETIALTVAAILLLVVVYNGIRLTGLPTGTSLVGASEVIPTGIPDIYGMELGISYDDISPSNPGLADATIEKMSQYEDLELTPEQMERYIRIGGSISCEYCCGAASIIFSNGDRACGCAHSYAMRGLAKYLIINHPDEFTDVDILSELGKWKVLFFPGIHETKASVLESQGIEVNYISLASNQYRGIEQGAQSDGGMIGDC